MAEIDTKFYLDDLEIDEPEGYDTLAISILRDDSLHGIGVEASVNSLKFYGAAYDYIENIYSIQGLTSIIVFRSESNCTTSGEYEIIVKGKLNIGKKQSHCGSRCYTSLLIETETCESILNNKFDVDIDVDKITTQNGITPLVAYENLDIDMTLPTRELPVKNEGYVITAGDPFDMENFPLTLDASEYKLYIRPILANAIAENINQSELDGSAFFAQVPSLGLELLSPMFLFDEVAKCFDGSKFDYSVRLKGNANFHNSEQGFTAVKLVIAYGEFPDSIIIIDSANVPFTNSPDPSIGGVVNTDFDHTFIGTNFSDIVLGKGFYAWFEIDYPNSSPTIVNPIGNITFDSDTHFLISTTKKCPPTTAKVYLVHELLSRLAESITDGCMRVKSAYYGRTDSQPFAFDDDGCGGLRFLTSGLKLRKAPNASFFINLKKLITGLQNIDNIGMGVEEDETIPGYFILRIEDLDFFYQDVEIMQHLNIPDADFTVEEERNYSIINIGYKKWETLANFGLDEFNSNRQYHTNIATLTGTIDLTADLVAGEYALEITRDQSFVDTSEADTGYDNDAFIVCLKRLAYNSFEVEQGGIVDPENIFSPDSVYNYRISPVRNLMRWFRSLINAYPNLNDSSYKLFFSSGTGNFKASGQLAEGYGYGSEFCKMEGVDVAENADLFATMFNDVAKKIPIWKNETITYSYPMSIADYKKIKAKRYGYITYQCGNGDLQRGWIKDIEFTPAKGLAKIILRKTWL